LSSSGLADDIYLGHHIAVGFGGGRLLGKGRRLARSLQNRLNGSLFSAGCREEKVVLLHVKLKRTREGLGVAEKKDESRKKGQVFFGGEIGQIRESPKGGKDSGLNVQFNPPRGLDLTKRGFCYSPQDEGGKRRPGNQTSTKVFLSCLGLDHSAK